MKKILFCLGFLALSALSFSQVVSNGPGGFTWTDDEPFHNPGSNGAKFAVDRNTFIWYEWTGTTWTASGDRIQGISGCSAPAYVPGKNNSNMVINGCQQIYQYYGGAWQIVNPVASVASVADSAAFRAYVGAADLLIMRDTARGGEFAKCVPCVADNYMVFTDGNGNKWRRINYDRILESWWGKWGHVSLQRAINYVAQKGSGTVGVLTHNQDITLKDSVRVWDGVQIHGFSPPLVPGTHPLDSPAKNVITLDLNNANKGAIVWDDNGRGYSDATLIKNVGIVAVSPCRAALVVKKPNGGNISDILIAGGGEVIADRKITNAIEVSATVYTNWNNINIIGAKTGIKEIPAAFSGGTLTITGTSSIRRCVTAIDMAAYGAILATGLFLENIDTTGIRCNTLFWSGAYTENVPMAANGTAVQTLSGDAVINIQNVKFNGGTNCISGDCAAFDGAARHVMLLNNDYYNINKIVRSPNAPTSGVLGGGTWYNVATRTQNVYGNSKWTCGAIAQYSGGTPDTVSSWYTGRHGFKILTDANNSTGLEGQILSSNGDETMAWIDPPSSIPSGTAGQLVRYNTSTTVSGESSLFWDAVNSRFGIGTTSPTRRLTVQDGANAYLQVRGENNGGIELYVSNASPNCAWDSYASRGNLTTPTATNAGNTLGQFRFFGHTGSAYRQAASIRIINTVNSSVGGGVPTDMIFSVTRNGFGGATDRVWIKNRGYFSVGTQTPSAYFTVKSDDSGVPNVRLISSANDSTGIYVRSTTPEGSQAAPPGSLSVLTDGSLFSKRTGTGNTGWSKFFNLSDPALASTTATTGQIPKWNGTAWEAAADASGGTPGGSDTQIQYNNSGVFGGSSNLVWDNTGKRLSVNQSTPTAHVHIESLVSGNGQTLFTLRNPNGTTATNQYVTMGIGQAGGGPGNGQFVISRGTQIFGGGDSRDALIIDGSSNVSLREANIINRRLTSSNGGGGLENAAGNYFEIGKRGDVGPWTVTTGDVNIITTPVLPGWNPNNHAFAPTSGSANFTVFNINPIINQTGTSNGVIRPIRYNPTILSLRGPHYAATFASGQFGIGTETPNPSAQLDVTSTTGGLLPPRMTTTQRDAIASPADGLMLYSSTAGDMQLRANGIWTDVQAALKATATLDFPSTANNTNSDLTVTVTGAAVGDAVSVAPGLAAISNHSCYTAWVSATNTVTVRFNHYGTGGATDPASASFNIIVHKF